MTPTWTDRVRRLRDWALEHWPIKITALVLAAILWAAVAAQEPTSQVVPVQLVVEPPAGRTLAAPLPAVHAVYRGSPRELIKLYSVPPVLHAVLPDSVTGSEYALELGLGDLHVEGGANVTPQELEPRLIVVQLDAVSQRAVPVAPRVVLEVDSGFQQFGPLTVTPRKVVIRGAQAAVAQVESIPTAPLRLTDVTAPVRQSIRLDTTGLTGISLSHRDVVVVADVDAVSEKVLIGIPVVVEGSGQLTSDPVAVIVTVRGRASRLPSLTRDSVQAVARGSGIARDQRVALEILSPDGTVAWATPDSVTLRRVRGP
jgi:hypothetical protein